MCSKVLLPGSIIEVFEKLLSFASKVVDDEGENPWQSCANFYVTCILSCLPWGGAELSEVTLFLFSRHFSSMGGGWSVLWLLSLCFS